MQRTPGSIRNEPLAKLTALEKERPEWRTWLRLLRAAAGAIDSEWFSAGNAAELLPPTETGAPLLHAHEFSVAADRVNDLVTQLLAITSTGGNGSPPIERLASGESLGLLEAALRSEEESVVALADRLQVSPGILRAVSEFLVLPLLHSAASALADKQPRHWPYGYCPVCGTRPTLAELRGLDRARLLRCGRCGAAWEMAWLRCVHCGERDHNRLGSLVPEERAETHKVETCESCGGYLKVLTTLEASSHLDLLLRDLDTVDLDLVALDRGYARPSGPGFALEVRVVDAGSADEQSR